MSYCSLSLCLHSLLFLQVTTEPVFIFKPRSFRMLSQIDCLKQTKQALQQISEALEPFLSLLQVAYKSRKRTLNHGDDCSKHSCKASQQRISSFQVAEAEAAVALAMGTLRFMARRLQGKGDDKTGNHAPSKDSLRLELEKMKKLLMELKQLKKKEDENEMKQSSKNHSNTDVSQINLLKYNEPTYTTLENQVPVVYAPSNETSKIEMMNQKKDLGQIETMTNTYSQQSKKKRKL